MSIKFGDLNQKLERAKSLKKTGIGGEFLIEFE